MASRFASLEQSVRCSLRVSLCNRNTKAFSTTSVVPARRPRAEEKLTADQAFDLLDDEFDDDDTVSAGHIMLRNQRQMVHYMRLIEHEMPKLVGASLILIFSVLDENDPTMVQPFGSRLCHRL